MTMPTHARRNVTEATPRALSAATAAFEKNARLGSAALKLRIANAIVRHARVESLPIPQAMNVLLYAGELT